MINEVDLIHLKNELKRVISQRDIQLSQNIIRQINDLINLINLELSCVCSMGFMSLLQLTTQDQCKFYDYSFDE